MSAFGPLGVGAVVATMVAAALWALQRATDRAPRSLASARAAMFGEASAAEPGLRDGRWLSRHFGDGLDVIGVAAPELATRMVVGAAAMMIATLAAVSVAMAAGLLPVAPWWLALVPLAGALSVWIVMADTASRITRRRRELRQAANDFIQLVAVGLTTDQSVEEAIGFALTVGSSPAFEQLRDELTTAPQRGVPVWEAIDEFGRRGGVRELSDFAHSVERQGTQGVSIGQTALTLAAAMRAKALDQLEREADRANANLSGPTIGFVVTTIVFLAYPLAQRISDAFGGW